MSATKPVKLYMHAMSPNPWKVFLIVFELGIPYELVEVKDVKSAEYLAINPNGRVPALEDPNTGVATWESGSIIEYLIEMYDTKHSISYPSAPQKFWENNWKHFQMSGQGPYFGQKAWFSRYHPEKVPSAEERYAREIERILSVIDLHLGRTGTAYLVGDKFSYVDMMWFPWNNGVSRFLLGTEFEDVWKTKYPLSHAWHQRLASRDSVKKMQELLEPIMAASQ